MKVTYPFDKLLRYIQDKGYVKELRPTSSKGEGRFKKTALTSFLEYDPNSPESALHESSHALYENAPSRVEQQAKDMGSLTSSEQKDLALPSHWIRGGMENTSLPFFRKPKGFSSEMTKLSQRAAGIYGGQVNVATPSDMIRSGFRSSDYSYPKYANVAEEAHVYSSTSPVVNPNAKERKRNLGLLLRDRGVPWEIIDPIIRNIQE